MGSRVRHSTRKAKPGPVKPPPPAAKPSAAPPAVTPVQEIAENVVGQLADTRSVFSVALKALDNIDERGERRLDAPVVCGPDDVATVLRVGIVCLDEAREALQTEIVEGKS